MGFHEDEDAMLVMIGLRKLMTKHGIKPSLSKSQHATVTKNGLDNIRRNRQCTGKESGVGELYFYCVGQCLTEAF